MAIVVEGYVGGKKVSYDLIKFQQALLDTLESKGLLTEEEVKALFDKSQ
jgi:hypothetical protein